MKRKIVKIDEGKCNGCGLCIPECKEGALQIIDDKARLISDLFCDGLGACLGYCPQGAITIEEREAVPYDEKKVMETVAKQGKNTVIAHLKHLKEHGEEKFLSQAINYLNRSCGVDCDLFWSGGAGITFHNAVNRKLVCHPAETSVDPAQLAIWACLDGPLSRHGDRRLAGVAQGGSFRRETPTRALCAPARS